MKSKVFKMGPNGPEEAGGMDGVLAELMADMVEDKKGRESILPATVAQYRWLTDGSSYLPAVGDIVTLRDDQPPGNMRFPEVGEQVIVTQILPQATLPVDDASGPVKTGNIAVLYTHRCGKPECEMEGALVEYAYDSRLFRKVGNVDDNDTPKRFTPKAGTGGGMSGLRDLLNKLKDKANE